MIGSMNRPGDQSNIFHPFNVQRQNMYNTEASLKYFIVQVFATATLLYIVVIKTLKEELFTFERNIYTSVVICTPLLLKSGAAPLY